ncbi:MAG: type IV toxin-antitoxin system AbiEi family antitoxin domain-containing protein [Candidatus Aminicenantaceae bacterium]
MKWGKVLHTVEKEPVFSSSVLKAGTEDPVKLGIQLSRWVEAGKLIQIRRGLYALSEQYRKTEPHPFYIANRIKRASYVSLQSALEHYGLIPEYVPAVTSVTTGRPQTFETPLGIYIYRHVKKELFFDCIVEELTGDQSAFIASPEKALLDLFHLTPGSDDLGYIKELRLQNWDNLNILRLKKTARLTGSPKLIRVSKIIENLKEEL